MNHLRNYIPRISYRHVIGESRMHDVNANGVVLAFILPLREKYHETPNPDSENQLSSYMIFRI